MNPIPAETPKEKLLHEFNTVVAETEQLLKTAAGAGSDKASLEREFAAAREHLARLRDEALTQANAVAKTADEYVHANPWRSVGVVATVALAAGLVAGLLISRR